ncbi:P-loop containing nucleoside triphosphate hydrolase protein [Sporodiniella umbellata]|nr:P-loop containing nucleoside triphosphate hydrolase protein [Sporodiniella umbellata]
MEDIKKISRKEFLEKYKPIGLTSLQNWQYKPSVRRILKRKTNGRETTYDIQFVNNQIANVPGHSIETIYPELIQSFEKEIRSNTNNLKPVRTKTSDSSDGSSYNSESNDDIDEADSEGIDSEDSQSENEDATNLSRKTRSGRVKAVPKSFQQEFYPTFDIGKKPINIKPRHIPLYSNETIECHSQKCFRCFKGGLPNGSNGTAVSVLCGPTVSRHRLLLCKTCSLVCHNNCLPALCKQSFDSEGNYNCAKCRISTDCSGCHEKLLKNSQKVVFRCTTCLRGYHSKCIKNGSDDGSRCQDCIYYDGKQATRIVAKKTDEKGEELLILWKGQSFRHVSWVPSSWFKARHASLYKNYEKKYGDEDTPIKRGRYFPIEWTIIERILNVEWEDKKSMIPKKVLAVYKDTGYDEALWDDLPTENEPEAYTAYQMAFERYIRATKVKPPQKMKQLVAEIRKAADTENYASHELKVQPKYMDGGILMPHQMEALNWLLFQWEKQQPCVLADDMGLGKTIQIISFLYVLFRKYNIYPFIIVVPNSTATNWVREFQKWAPDMAVVPFFGMSASRHLALENEIFDSNQNLKCHAIVATYEAVLEPSKLQKIFWPVMIVDESQRLKNDESYLFKALNGFNKDQSVLLTGTPLQNNLRELFNIMHFIRPKDFHGEQAEDYSNMSRSQVDELHGRLRPYFLRRTKEEILKTLPPKHEIIVPLSMSPLQKEVYKSCLSRDIESILGTTNYKRSKGLTSIFMNLRKTLNHPFLIDGVETPCSSAQETQQAMIDACEKLKFFHQMLPKLRAKGHRVLLFSTMTRALDIIDDYLTHEEIDFVRLDGTDSERDRVRSIDAFNAPKSKLDVFLLSTRAGGVGINLATADTVIIWDSDFNPYADLQAIGRAHRIGQTKMVLIYRFMTRLSVEERILQIGRKKMALEHVVVEKMSTLEEDTVDDIESILKFGAQALFDDDDSADITYDSAAIERLLDRDQYKALAEAQKERDIEESKNSSGALSFGNARVWKAEGGVEELADKEADQGTHDDFWEKFLLKKQEEAKKKKAEKLLHDQSLGRGARKRAKVSYSEKEAAAEAKRQRGLVLEQDDDYKLSDTEDQDPIEEIEETQLIEDTNLREEINDITNNNKPTKSRKEPSKEKRLGRPRKKPVVVQPPKLLISRQYSDQLTATINTIFENHCKAAADYMIECGRNGMPSDFCENNVKAGVSRLLQTLHGEFTRSIDVERSSMIEAGTPVETIEGYIQTKSEIFDRIICSSVINFDSWRVSNQQMFLALGIHSRNPVHTPNSQTIVVEPEPSPQNSTGIRIIHDRNSSGSSENYTTANKNVL